MRVVCLFSAIFPLAPLFLSGQQFPVAILGGQDGTGGSSVAYAAFVDPAANAAGSSLINLPSAAGSFIRGVAINDLGQAVICGSNGSFAYAASVSAQTNTVNGPISGFPTTAGSHLSGIAINDFNDVLAAGYSGIQSMIGAFVDINTNTAGPNISGLPSPSGNTFLNGAAINNTEQALVVGVNVNVSYAATVDPNTNAVVAVIANTPTASGDGLYGVSLNQSGLAIIVGRDPGSGAGYATFIQPGTNTASPNILQPSMLLSKMSAASLNDFGEALIGGQTNASTAYAAFVDPVTHVVYPISNLPSGANGVIHGVSINNYGQGLIGGFDGTGAYAAFVDPITRQASSPITNLPATLGSIIWSVGLVKTPSLPTSSLHGNSLKFANYINANAPQVAFYFVPAWINGGLEAALEVAAPTRNAISLFTADNNLLFLNHGLSVHLRNQRHFRERKIVADSFTTMREDSRSSSPFVASLDAEMFSCPESPLPDLEGTGGVVPKRKPIQKQPTCSDNKPVEVCEEKVSCKDLPYSLWFEAIGAFAKQEEQDQTPSFTPSLGGAIFAFDKTLESETALGAGVAYTFTHVGESKDLGYSRINQEYLFAYATWMGEQFYVDGALWTGFFQTHQVRDIAVSGFIFQSTSSPYGWQLSPHVEFGYDHLWTFLEDCRLECILDPFVMLDWVNAWQSHYRETGPSPFNIGQKRSYSSMLRAEVGLRFYQTYFLDSWNFSFEEKASYVNKTPFGVGRVSAFLVGSPGSFTVETFSSSQNLGVFEITFIAEPADHTYPYGSLSYQGEFGPSYQSHQITAEVSWDF